MLNVKILGSNAVIKTDILFGDLVALAKFKPEALIIKNEEGKEVYKISVNKEGKSTISNYGTVFVSKDAEGFAELNITIDEAVAADKRVDYIKENFGYKIMRLSEALIDIASNLNQFRSDFAEIESNIEVVG